MATPRKARTAASESESLEDKVRRLEALVEKMSERAAERVDPDFVDVSHRVATDDAIHDAIRDLANHVGYPNEPHTPVHAALKRIRDGAGLTQEDADDSE